MSPASKQTLKKKPAGALHKRPATTNQHKEEAVAEEEQDEVEEEEGVEEKAGEEDEEAEEEEEQQQEQEEAEEGEQGEEEEEEGHEVADKGEKAEEKEEARETATARQVRIKWGMKRSYIQEKDSEGLWRTVVTVSEKQSDNHKEVIRAIFNAMMQDMGFGKEQALAMRTDFFSGIEMFNGIL